jgi:hypothetical protein
MPELDPSLAIAAVKGCVPPPAIDEGFVGVSVTDIGVSAIVAVADLLGSDLLVAVTVADVAVTGDGAVYTPAAVIEPAEACQVTPALAESLLTVAMKVCVAPPINVAEPGLTETAIGCGVCVPLPPAPPQPDNVLNTEKPRKIQKNSRNLDMQEPISTQDGRQYKAHKSAIVSRR